MVLAVDLLVVALLKRKKHQIKKLLIHIKDQIMSINIIVKIAQWDSLLHSEVSRFKSRQCNFPGFEVQPRNEATGDLRLEVVP